MNEIMRADVVGLNEIRVYLSKKYYNGMSSKFFLKDLKTGEITLLSGDALESYDSEYQEYVINTSFHMGRAYHVIDAYGMSCCLDFSKFSMCEDFDDLYHYEGTDLGCIYSPEKSLFKLWAPCAIDVLLKIENKEHQEMKVYPMTRGLKGVYYCCVEGDLEEYHYVYLIKHSDVYKEVVDPYAYASSANGQQSIVIDLDKIYTEPPVLPPLVHKTDAIIYEMNIRDFSIHPSGEMKNKGKFLALCEEGTYTESGYETGLDYLKSLGITHVQLMPINDFATVDEEHPSILYNWGYDPSQYNVTEGSYVSDPHDGYKRILEAKQMIDALHQAGIRVIIDVVFNHMFDMKHTVLEKCVPYYYFRRYTDGTLSNGSWCGNDLNTSAKMCRHYILDMCRRWQEIYHVDGFRFDLMGLIDIETIQAIEEQGRAMDPSFMVYGEGWNMETALSEDKRSTMDNHRLLPHISFFNDTFRNTMRGTNQMESLGYMSGDTYQTFEAMKMLCCMDKFSSISQSINYVECHDNGTCYDKLLISNNQEDEETRKRRLRMMLTAVILSQGIPFIHSGQEFFRTKYGQTNTYNAGDHINGIDWSYRDAEIETVDYVKFLIQLRKNNPCFRYDDYRTMKECIELHNIDHRMIQYHLHQSEGEYHEIIVYMNASNDDLIVHIEKGYEVLYHSDQEDILSNQLTIPATGIGIVVK